MSRFFLILSIIPFACTPHSEENVADSRPKIIETDGEVVPKDSVDIPLVKTIAVPKPVAGSPQIITAKLPRADFSNFNTDNGLALDAISCAYTDQSGCLWFGTYGGGISKYNGKTFATLTTSWGLSDNNVMTMAQDRMGKMWIGTSSGLVVYDGVNFIPIQSEKSLNSAVVRIFEDNSGNLWFGTLGEGVTRYDGKYFTNYTTADGLAENTVWAITQDSKGDIWFGTESNGLSVFDGERFVTIPPGDTLPIFGIRSMITDRNNHIWITTFGYGAFRYDGMTFHNFTSEEGLPNDAVWTVFEDLSGLIWFGTYGSGCCSYDGKTFSNFTDERGLAHNRVLAITEDSCGYMWFGTYGGGISRYNGPAFTYFDHNQGMASSDIKAIMETSDGNLWFGSLQGGAHRYDGESFQTYTTENGLISNSILSLMEDRYGNIWMGSYGYGVTCFDGSKFYEFSTESGLPGNDIRCILEDLSGDIWIGTEDGGACRISASQGDIAESDSVSLVMMNKTSGLSGEQIECIIQDNSGDMWFATNGNGFCRLKYNRENLSTQRNEFIHFNSAIGLADAVNHMMADGQNNLWFGTADKGLLRYDGSSFLSLSEKEGLANNAVYGIVEGADGVLWIGTNIGYSGLRFNAGNEDKAQSTGAGLLRQSNLELQNMSTAWDIYNNQTGYPVKDLNTNAVLYKRNADIGDVEGKIAGQIWGGCGNDKLVCFEPASVKKNFEASRTFITAVRIQEELFSWYDFLDGTDSTLKVRQRIATFRKMPDDSEISRINKKFHDIEFDGIAPWYPVPLNPVIPYHHNSVTFDFIATETGRNFMVNYQYALLNDHEAKPNEEEINWSPNTKHTSATFNNLWEGDYLFVLRASSPEGIWSSPVSYSFSILPPPWRTYWAYTFYILLLILSLWLFARINSSRLRKRAAELNKKVIAATDEIRFQKSLIEQKHLEITDSITYSRRIQNAILPPLSMVNQLLPDSFVYFKPKDIVAGDFYWFEKLAGTNTEDTIIFAAADCTGHGVPGALVSVICNNGLNRSVREYGLRDPGEILNKTREIIISEFGKSEEDVKDGMDIAICSLQGNELRYAGANNPIWIVRQASQEFEEVKADRQPIGKCDDPKPFTSHSFNVQKGDMIYIFTDGFADQFGGDKGKKFKPSKLKELFIAISQKPIPEQNVTISNAFDEWRDGYEQVDDICIIGVRI